MKGKVTVVAGYPRECEDRTELVLRIVREHIALGIPCLYFNLEYTSILLKKKIEDFNEHRNLRMTDTRLLDIYDIPGISIDTITGILEEYKNHNLFPVVVIDGIELVSLRSDDEDYDARMKEALEATRHLADSFGTSIFITKYARRQFEHRKEQWYSISDIPLDDVFCYVDNVLFCKPSDSDGKAGYVVCQGSFPVDSPNIAEGVAIIDQEEISRQIFEIRRNHIRISDKKLTDCVTETLLRIAKNPKVRMDYAINIAPGINEYCSVNRPMISNLELLVMAKYKSVCLVYESSEYIDEKESEIMGLIDRMSDSMDYCGALSFLNRKKYERFYHMNDFAKAKLSLLSALDYATNDNDGVAPSDIDSLLDVLSKNASETELFDWISDVSGHAKEHMKSYYFGKVEDEKELGRILNECIEYADAKWEIVQDQPAFKNLEWLPYAIMQAYGIVDTRKRRSPKKDSFDWHYSKAEKGNKDSQRFISEAFRTGNGVAQNDILAAYWNEVANQ